MASTLAPLMYQNPVEFQQLLDLYVQRRPSRVLEVGVGEGGTLWHWLRHAGPDTLVVAVDDRHVNIDDYHAWLPDGRAPGIGLVVYTGSSHDPDVLLDVAAHRPYDWIFIDADHHDAAVRADWRHFSAMAAPGALVALHDITPTPDPTIEVDGLWAELTGGYETVTFEEYPRNPGAYGIAAPRWGIGVVFLP